VPTGSVLGGYTWVTPAYRTTTVTSAHTCADSSLLTAAVSGCYAGSEAFSRERVLDALARLLFIDGGRQALAHTTELAPTLT